MQTTTTKPTSPNRPIKTAAGDMAGSNQGAPMHHRQEQTIEQVFAAGDVEVACDFVWQMATKFVSDRIPAGHPQRSSIILKVCTSITQPMSPDSLRDIRKPFNYTSQAIRRAFGNVVDEIATA